MISLRGKRLCPELKLAIDRVLKLNGWIVHMDQDRGVYLGNQHLECHLRQHWE